MDLRSVRPLSAIKPRNVFGFLKFPYHKKNLVANALAIAHTNQGITVTPVLADTLGTLSSARGVSALKPILKYCAIIVIITFS